MNGASCGSMTSMTASDASNRARVWRTKSSIDASRIGSGNITAAAPASHVASIAVTSGRVVGPRIATCVPGPTPCAWRPAAIAQCVVVEPGPRHALTFGSAGTRRSEERDRPLRLGGTLDTGKQAGHGGFDRVARGWVTSATHPPP